MIRQKLIKEASKSNKKKKEDLEKINQEKELQNLKIINPEAYKQKLIEIAQNIDSSKQKKPKLQDISDNLESELNKIKSIEEPKQQILNESSDDWDVKIGDEITYFDPSLSYELTGYRPITKDKGLDFDPTPFTLAGKTYEETGKYTNYIPGSVMYKQFWRTEKERCENGYTVGKYTLTGDNYFWLNYYRLLNVSSNTQQSKGRVEGFPIFLNKQYEYFHYMELCKRLGKDFCALKSRGVGASEIACSLGARMYTTTKNSRSVYTASTEVLLQPTLEKCWLQLDFLNGETQGGFKHLRMKKDTDKMKKASKVDKDGQEYGHNAIIEGVISDTPRKLRGRRVENLFFEESGSNPNLIETYIQSEPLVNFLGRRIGTRYVFGTGR